MIVRDRADPASEAVRGVRARFLAAGNPYGCAEATLLALGDACGLPDATDGAAAMALNGGVAYGGGTCGAITGAAIALGLLAARRIPDRATAKRVARELTAGALDDFRATFGATDCRTLTGVDLRAPGGHEAFMAAGAWRVDCLSRLELMVRRLAPLAGPAAWSAALDELEGRCEAQADDERANAGGARR
jgi:C_GCAxxG_C_C family probable redox protein